MPFELHAFVVRPDFSTDADGEPLRIHHTKTCSFVLVNTFNTLKKAQDAAQDTQRVFVDPPDNLILATEQQIPFYEIREVP